MCTLVMDELKRQKKRVPKLSIKLNRIRDIIILLFVTRMANQKAEDSQLMYPRRIIENYDKSAEIVTPKKTQSKNNFPQSPPVIANAYIQHERERVRTDGAKRIRGRISAMVFVDNRRQVLNIIQMEQNQAPHVFFYHTKLARKTPY